VNTKLTEKISSSFLFLLASLLTGFVSFLAFGFVWAKQRGAKPDGAQKVQGFLADKHRALNFYRIFSVAYDILNPYLYTDTMRNEMVSQIKVGADLRVLDVGCGTGYTTSGVLIRRDVCEVVGLDMNPVQLSRAVKNLRSKKAILSISRGDAENLPFVDDSFDAVISVGAIEYFPDPERVLRELARVVNSNGNVIVCGPESGWFSKFALNRVFYTPSVKEMGGIFRNAGLIEVKSVFTGVSTFFGTGRYVVFTVGTKSS
jgi:demethylmenaquinone methyltransferase/2-methoxy-6-polyprenyl-1,4-benzoquinol methylase